MRMHALRGLYVATILIVAAHLSLAAGPPISDAVAVWHMDERGDPAGPVAVHGAVTLGVELTGAEREESLRRGGDGRVASFDGGYLCVGSKGDPSVSLHGIETTFAVRLRDPSGTWNAPLFGADRKDDRYANILTARDGSLHYIWRTEPAARRVLAPSTGMASYGFNGESNDQHSLAAYSAGEFAISTLTLDETGSVTLFHDGQKTSGKIDIQKQNVGDALLRVGAKHDGSEFLDGDIAEILVFDRVVPEVERVRIEARLRAKWELGQADRATADSVLPTRGMVLHLDAGDVRGDQGHLETPGPLAAWHDTSGSGRVLSQDDRERQPELVPGALGGRAVVRFHGGQFLDGPPVLPAGSNHFSFIVIWRRVHSLGSEVIVEQSSPGVGRRACLLTTGASDRSTDFTDGILGLAAPLKRIDPTAWHDVVVRFRGPNLELFVDGVLIDEEWPHGELFQFCAPFLIGAGYEQGELASGFRGQIDHVALWNRALRDEEIVELAGGAESVARRDVEINGPPQASMQYWKPRG